MDPAMARIMQRKTLNRPYPGKDLMQPLSFASPKILSAWLAGGIGHSLLGNAARCNAPVCVGGDGAGYVYVFSSDK